jgi:hypothetical protein
MFPMMEARDDTFTGIFGKQLTAGWPAAKSCII